MSGRSPPCVPLSVSIYASIYALPLCVIACGQRVVKRANCARVTTPHLLYASVSEINENISRSIHALQKNKIFSGGPHMTQTNKSSEGAKERSA